MDTAKLESVLKAKLPRFGHLISCERLSAGASRETYRIKATIAGEDKLIALRRSPRGEASAMQQGPGLSAEAKLFEAARKGGVPGPEVFYVLQSEDDLGSGFFMEWISGETLGAKIARSPDFADIRRSLARQCGEILARLHAVDVKAAGLAATLDTMTPEQCVQKTFETYLSLSTPQPMIDYTAKWLRQNAPKQHRMALVHSDFRNGNLITDPKRGVVAVLDWELAHIGDPMRDLGWIVTRSWRFGVPAKPVGGFGDLDDLIASYESTSGQKVDRSAVMWWEVFGSYWWAVGTLSMAQSWRSGAEKSVERPAIGRRTTECQIDCVNLVIPGPARRPPSTNSTGTPPATPPDTPPDTPPSSDNLPTTSELILSVRDFLRTDALLSLKDRNAFLARVAANALDIVEREQRLGPDAARHEAESLAGLGCSSRADLCEAIRSNRIGLDSPELQQHLRDTVLAQALIDQPDYAGTSEASARSG